MSKFSAWLYTAAFLGNVICFYLAYIHGQTNDLIFNGLCAAAWGYLAKAAWMELRG